MNTRNSAILGFCVGYFGAAMIPVVIAYLLLMPFGYGYVGAELVAAYFVWTTINQWEMVNLHLSEMLDKHGY